MKLAYSKRIIGIAGFILGLVYIILYISRVNCSLTYYWQQWVPMAFGEYLKYPGGLAELFANQFTETFNFPFWGTLGIIELILITYLSLDIIFRKYSSHPFYSVLLMLAIVPFTALFAHYRLPVSLIASIVGGTFFAAIISLLTPSTRWLRILFYLAASAVVYMAGGSAALAMIIQVILIRALISGQKTELYELIPVLLIPLAYLPLNLAFTLKKAYLGSFLISKYDDLPIITYFSLFAPILIMSVHLAIGILVSRSRIKAGLLPEGLGILFALGVLFAVTFLSVNTTERDIYSVEQASFDKNWGYVLELTDDEFINNKIVQFEINRALYMNGILLDRLFRYPQSFGEKAIFLEDNPSSRLAIHMGDFYTDLGYALEARHWSTEAEMAMMRHPVVLKNLILSYLAIGREEAALKYLKILSRSKLKRPWCEDILAMIEEGEYSGNMQVQSFLLNNPDVDFFASSKQNVDKLKAFYGNNRNNNMAFEFLIASYLLTHNLGSILPLIPDFRNYGYEVLPRAVEEAIMVYLAQRQAPRSILAGYALSENTISEFQDFTNLMASGKTREESKNNVSKYSDTYWYYILFSSPYATNK